jgi:hypothetical protein
MNVDESEDPQQSRPALWKAREGQKRSKESGYGDEGGKREGKKRRRRRRRRRVGKMPSEEKGSERG